jgi:hypothetical protein
VIQRQTQTEAYWQEQFTVTEKDVSYVYGLILDEARPFALEALALALIERHCRQEEETIQAELSKGAVYQPKDTYEIGAPIIFPALNYALGVVEGSRPGKSPEYGEFTVITVRFEESEEEQDFASALEGDHPLNRDQGVSAILAGGDLLGPEQLYELHGGAVDAALEGRLEEREEFIRFGNEWFLKDLLVPVDLGQLNIAEALVEIKSMPLSTQRFVAELDLPRETPEEILALSLNRALEADPRFDNIGDMGRDIWYLSRLTPETVIEPPARLVIEDVPYNRSDISDELLLIEREIDDEGSDETVMGPSRPLYRTTLGLTYSHWRSGTLPLTVRTRGLFPASKNHHSPIVLVDGQSGTRMQGWAVHGGGFVCGLGDWYRQHKLPVGAFVKLERTRDPHVVTVDFEPRRLKRLWITVATVRNRELSFELRKLPVACEYDEYLAIDEDSAPALDRLWEEAQMRGESLLETMVRIMPELIKLSPQSTVQAKTIYSAVNLLRRVSPGPIFALLSTERCFVAMGGGYWTFDEALVGS